MQRRLLAILAVLLLSGVWLATPRAAQAETCGKAAKDEVVMNEYTSKTLDVPSGGIVYVYLQAKFDKSDYRVEITGGGAYTGVLALTGDTQPILVSYREPAQVTVKILNDLGGLDFVIEVDCTKAVLGLNDGRVSTYNTEGAIYVTGDGIFVYRIGKDSKGQLWAFVRARDLNRAPEFPEQNLTLAMSKDNYIGIYKLTTGQYQVNIGPDKDGKVFVTRWTGIPATNVENTEFFLEPAK